MKAIEVKVFDNDLEKAMWILKKKIQNDGLFKRLKLKKSYENFIKSKQKDSVLTEKGKEISEKEKQLKKYKNAIIGILVIVVIVLLIVIYFLIKMLISN